MGRRWFDDNLLLLITYSYKILSQHSHFQDVQYFLQKPNRVSNRIEGGLNRVQCLHVFKVTEDENVQTQEYHIEKFT
jgi:hypothetical protein